MAHKNDWTQLHGILNPPTGTFNGIRCSKKGVIYVISEKQRKAAESAHSNSNKNDKN